MNNNINHYNQCCQALDTEKNKHNSNQIKLNKKIDNLHKKLLKYKKIINSQQRKIKELENAKQNKLKILTKNNSGILKYDWSSNNNNTNTTKLDNTSKFINKNIYPNKTNQLQNKESKNHSDLFINKFMSKKKYYKDINNIIVETFEIPSRIISKLRNIHLVINKIKESSNIESTILKYNQKNNTYNFYIKGISKFVKENRNIFIQSLNLSIRLIYRYLHISKETLEKLDLSFIERSVNIGEKIINCKIKIKNVKECDKTIEIIGDINTCDNVEEMIVSIDKVNKNTPDLILSFENNEELDTLEKFDNNNSTLVAKEYNCQILCQNNSLKIFSGSKQSFLSALKKINKIFTAKGEMTHIYKIPSNKLFIGRLNGILDKISKKYKCVLFYRKENDYIKIIYTNCLNEIINEIDMLFQPKSLIKINTEKIKTIFELMNSLKDKHYFDFIHLEKSEKIELYAYKKKTASFIQEIINKINKNVHGFMLKYHFKKYKMFLITKDIIDKVEEETDTTIYITKKDPSTTYINIIGDEINIINAKKMINSITKKELRKTEPLILKIPKHKSYLLSNNQNTLINNIKSKFNVKIKFPFFHTRRESNKNEIYNLAIYGYENDVKKSEEFIWKCLMKYKKPTKIINVLTKKISQIKGINNENINRIRRKTGCVIFIRTNMESSTNSIVEIYGNTWACKKVEEEICLSVNSKNPDRQLIIPESELSYITKENGKLLKEASIKCCCDIVIPSILSRDPLDKTIMISIYGENLQNISSAEKEIRNLASLVSKMDNTISRIVEVKYELLKKLEGNDSKLKFLIQDETKCQIVYTDKYCDADNEMVKIYLKGSQASCDAAMARFEQIKNIELEGN